MSIEFKRKDLKEMGLAFGIPNAEMVWILLSPYNPIGFNCTEQGQYTKVYTIQRMNEYGYIEEFHVVTGHYSDKVAHSTKINEICEKWEKEAEQLNEKYYLTMNHREKAEKLQEIIKGWLNEILLEL